MWAECDVYRFFGGQWESISAHFDDFEPSHWMPLPTIPGDTAAQEQAWPRLAISSQEQLAALLASVPALHEISAELIAECVFEQMQAATGETEAPEQAEQDAVKVPRELERWVEIEAICWRIFADGKKGYRGCTKERLEEVRDLLGSGE
ncbi:DUF551 domain-containing protein [Azotobacter chroococcum]|nr:DUF551 domain-containing protein [Azotobacter chroococcum]